METGFYTDERTGRLVKWKDYPPLVRFFRSVVRDPETQCWEWIGAKSNSLGYGTFSYGGHQTYILAHRFAYTQLVGPIEDGKVLNHLCENPGCVNPKHLECVTQRENLLYSPTTLPSIAVATTHCKYGHVDWGVNNLGKRYCMECQRKYKLWQYHANDGKAKQRAKHAAAKQRKIDEALRVAGLVPER